MKPSFITSLIITFISIVSAQTTSYFYITNPIQGSVFEAGATEPITWTNGLEINATVTLLTGLNALTMTTTGVTFTIQGGEEEYDWTVPTDLPQNATFSLQITYPVNGITTYSYSSAFTITGTTGQVVNNTFISLIATTATSSALPSSSAAIIATASSAAPVITRASSAMASTTSVARSASSLAASTTPTPSISDANTMKTPTLIVMGLAMLAASFIL